jgi:hypothetical protein
LEFPDKGEFIKFAKFPLQICQIFLNRQKGIPKKC